MRNRRHVSGYWGLGLVALVLAGCSETEFMDFMGAGKNVPDERLVATNPPLSVPPDLRLPPPQPANGQGRNAALDAAAPRTADLVAPPTGNAMPAPADAGRAAMAAQAPGPQTAAGHANAEGPEAQTAWEKLYRQHGISLYRPDGTKKTIAELNRELAEKIKEEKRRKNPHYGTILNIGSLFRDD